jgi:hypothetical protein
VSTTLGQPSWYAYFDLSQDPTNPRYDFTNSILGTMNGVFSAGGCFGALCVAWACDRLGRRSSILLASPVAVVGGALQGGAVHIAMFLVGRLLSGFAVGECVLCCSTVSTVSFFEILTILTNQACWSCWCHCSSPKWHHQRPVDFSSPNMVRCHRSRPVFFICSPAYPSDRGHFGPWLRFGSLDRGGVLLFLQSTLSMALPFVPPVSLASVYAGSGACNSRVSEMAYVYPNRFRSTPGITNKAHQC